LYALVGSLLSAAVTYAIGRALGRDLMRRFASPRVERIRRRLAAGGALPVAAIRAVPIAPFTLVNLLAGASRIPFRAYLVGTAAGMLPGMLALTALGAQIATTLRNPGIRSLAVLGVVAAVLFGASLWLRRLTRGRDDHAEAASA